MARPSMRIRCAVRREGPLIGSDRYPGRTNSMKLGEITGGQSYLSAAQIDRADLRFLWHSDFWDGPRSGMLVYRGEECWFEVIDESEGDDADWYRRFAVLRLSKEQHAEEVRWHQLFREKVGTHTDYV